MKNENTLRLGFLRAAYLNDNPYAIFMALNIIMDYQPYGIDDDSHAVIAEVPVWLLQALRETVVHRLDNPKSLMTKSKSGEKQVQTGKNNNEKSKTEKYRKDLICYLAAEQAGTEVDMNGKKLKGEKKFERAKQILEGQNLHLSIDAIKKYSKRHSRQDMKSMNFGNSLFMEPEDEAIYHNVVNYYAREE